MATEAAQTSPVGTDTESADEQGAASSQQSDSDAAEAQANQGNDDGSGDNGSGSRSIDSLPKWAQKEIREVRQEAAKYRTRAKEIEEQQRLAAMNEQERAVEEARREAARETEQQYQQRLLQVHARAALAEAGVVNPEKSIRLLDLDQVTLDEDGSVIGLDNAIETLTNDFPNLVKGSTTDPALGNRNTGLPATTDMNTRIRQAMGYS